MKMVEEAVVEVALKYGAARAVHDVIPATAVVVPVPVMERAVVDAFVTVRFKEFNQPVVVAFVAVTFASCERPETLRAVVLAFVAFRFRDSSHPVEVALVA